MKVWYNSVPQKVCNTTISNTEERECGTVYRAHNARALQIKGVWYSAHCTATVHTVPELCRARGVWPPETQCPSVQPLSPLARLQYSQCPQLVFLNNAQRSSLQAALSVEQVLQSSLSGISNTLPLAVFSLHCTHPPSYALGVRPAEQIRFACPAECRVATQSIP